MIIGVDKPFVEDGRDFDLPLSKFYKFEKRTATDFKVIQTGQPDLPPVPDFQLAQKKRLEELKAANVNKVSVATAPQSNAVNGTTGVMDNTKADNKTATQPKTAPVAPAPNERAAEGKVKPREEEPKRPTDSAKDKAADKAGCSCSLL